MQNTKIFINAKIILADEIIQGSIKIIDGKIAAIDEGKQLAQSNAIDMQGDYLLPGLVELHTDHIETHYAPRPGVRWNPIAAIQAHDAQIATSGITTVFDALRVGMDEDARFGAQDMKILADAILKAQNMSALRAEHFIHLRCEVSSPDTLEGYELLKSSPLIKLVSLMDHTPGQRQFTSMETHREYFQGKSGMSDEDYFDYVARTNQRADKYSRKNRQIISRACVVDGIALASHDDATLDHVNEAIEDKITIAEFPTTLEAAIASNSKGLKILMGSPNMVRGGSHSGNVSALELAEKNCLDIFSSDYVPASLIQSIFMVCEKLNMVSLPKAVKMASKTPAEVVGLYDRGEIAIGKRADLIRVRYEKGGVPIISHVWREGVRVA